MGTVNLAVTAAKSTQPTVVTGACWNAADRAVTVAAPKSRNRDTHRNLVTMVTLWTSRGSSGIPPVQRRRTSRAMNRI
ncbi:MAG TPA: hypothetical protein K8V84_11645, partial [Nocardiopsis listeri]|uniref:hypothetical protein n=1 Tax=Nocardiopsis listeri TaxID=53440 RepID=UPI001DCAC790